MNIRSMRSRACWLCRGVFEPVPSPRKAALERLYTREVSRLAGASRSGVLRVPDRFSVVGEKGRPAKTGHVAFSYINHQLVKNDVEQEAIRMMQKDRDSRRSLREIAAKLKFNCVPTKQGGGWQANTVRVILAQA